MEINIIEIIPKLHRKRLCFETIFKKSGNVFHAKTIFFEFTQEVADFFLLAFIDNLFSLRHPESSERRRLSIR